MRCALFLFLFVTLGLCPTTARAYDDPDNQQPAPAEATMATPGPEGPPGEPGQRGVPGGRGPRGRPGKSGYVHPLDDPAFKVWLDKHADFRGWLERTKDVRQMQWNMFTLYQTWHKTEAQQIGALEKRATTTDSRLANLEAWKKAMTEKKAVAADPAPDTTSEATLSPPSSTSTNNHGIELLVLLGIVVIAGMVIYERNQGE